MSFVYTVKHLAHEIRETFTPPHISEPSWFAIAAPKQPDGFVEKNTPMIVRALLFTAFADEVVDTPDHKELLRIAAKLGWNGYVPADIRKPAS